MDAIESSDDKLSNSSATRHTTEHYGEISFDLAYPLRPLLEIEFNLFHASRSRKNLTHVNLPNRWSILDVVTISPDWDYHHHCQAVLCYEWHAQYAKYTLDNYSASFSD